MPAEWIKLKLYCERTGESDRAVVLRRSKGIWIDGVHTMRRTGSKGLWVNYTEAQKWVDRGMESPYPRGLKSGQGI